MQSITLINMQTYWASAFGCIYLAAGVRATGRPCQETGLTVGIQAGCCGCECELTMITLLLLIVCLCLASQRVKRCRWLIQTRVGRRERSMLTRREGNWRIYLIYMITYQKFVTVIYCLCNYFFFLLNLICKFRSTTVWPKYLQYSGTAVCVWWLRPELGLTVEIPSMSSSWI